MCVVHFDELKHEPPFIRDKPAVIVFAPGILACLVKLGRVDALALLPTCPAIRDQLRMNLTENKDSP